MRKIGKNLDITGVDRSSDDPYENIVSSKLFALPLAAPVKLFAAATLTAAALGSSCVEEACGLFGELFRKLEVRPVPGIRVKDQPRIR